MRVRVPVVLAVAAFVLLAVVVARGTSGIPVGTLERDAGPVWSGLGQASRQSDASLEPVAYGAVVLIVVLGVMVLFGLSGVFYVLTGIRLRRKRLRQATPKLVGADLDEPPTAWMTKATRRALSEMDRRSGGPPSDAVIAAWVQLENEAAASGLDREPHQTPSEFTEAVLTRYQADARALQRLRALYHRARFGNPDDITAADVAEARQALEQIEMVP